jgi:ABC-type multidrug transport system ATPase subunit
MALRLIGLTRRFGGHVALDDVSLHVRAGDCYGFLGHNGAGKTTSMRIALGLERADAGRVIVDGFDAARWPREARARMGGLIETPGFHGHLGGVANLATLARLQGFDRAGAAREASRLVDSVGLAGAGGKPVRDYSQGMRQRLGIAQSLIGSPKVVLLDEPMNGLDPEGIEEIRRLLRRLTRDEGMTVLLSSHQLGEIAGLCNRIGILRQGRLLVEEETSTLLAAESGRYALATADDAAAARILASIGVASKPRGAGELEVSLGERRAGDVARELVGKGVEVRTWAPRPPSLEEIYLRFTQGGETQASRPTSEPPSVAASTPSERVSPWRAPWRVVGYELRRWTSTPAVPLMLLLPALLAVGAVWSRHGDLVRDTKDVASGALATATNVTAFEAVGTALQSAVPALVLLLVGLASQSLAGENSRGTLRNVLLRPLKRVDVVSGKGAALFLAAGASYLLVELAALLAAGHWFEFKDVAEILPNGRTFVIPGGAAEKMWPEGERAVLMLIPVVFSFVGVGFLAGATARAGAAALAFALGLVALLQVLRVPAEILHVEGWLPTAHMPWPRSFGDQSVVQSFIDAAQVVSNPRDPHAGLHVIVPVAWTLATIGAAAIVLRRRSIK